MSDAKDIFNTVRVNGDELYVKLEDILSYLSRYEDRVRRYEDQNLSINLRSEQIRWIKQDLESLK